MSVSNNPLDRLYAGALLGKSLTKQLGESDAEQGQNTELGQRKATIEAGVAAGTINPSKLSKGDATLLGAVLGGESPKIPSLFKSPLKFAGGLASNLAKGAGEFAENLGDIPQGLLATGKAGVESIEKAHGNPAQEALEIGEGSDPEGKEVRAIASNTLHDFSSPKQIYEHPFEPLLDVAGVASGGAGAAVKGAGALARTGALGSEADIAASAGIGAKLVRAGSVLGRPDAIASPGFTEANADRLADAGVEASKIPRAYSPNLGMKYVVQKPLDSTISRLKDVKFPSSEETIGDLQGKYQGNKLINKTRAQISAAQSQSLMNGPIQDYLNSVQRVVKTDGPGSAAYQTEAAALSSSGFDTLDKLDSAIESIRGGEDPLEGPITTPEMQAAAEHRLKVYEDPRFRQLIESPTDAMKDISYQLRRVNVMHAHQLDVDPTTTENSMFGRLRELTGGTNEEVAASLKPELRPENTFAKGLQALQQEILGVKSPDVVPAIHELAAEIPYNYGTFAQRQELVQRAVDSLKLDLEDKESLYDRGKDPNYLQGNNLFQKIAAGLHDDLGVDEEQAQAFARGVALGSPDGPILPTYIPSMSSEGMHFGVRRAPIATKAGRMLGVSKLKPLAGDIEDQPNFYRFKGPFSPRKASAETIGLGPSMNYLKEANYDSFLKGMQRFDPQAIVENAYKIQEDLMKRMNQPMLEKLAMKSPDGTPMLLKGPGEMMEKLGNQAQLYEFVPTDTWRNLVKMKTNMEADVAGFARDMSDTDENDIRDEIEGIVQQSAQEFVAGEEQKAAMGYTQGYAIPKTLAKTIVDHVRISEQGSAVGRTMAWAQGRWKMAVLSLSPAWLFRTTLGHGIVAMIDGTINPKYWVQAHDYLADRPILQEHLSALKGWEKSGDKVLNPMPVGVHQGGMQQDLTDSAEGKLVAKQNILGRTIQRGVHTTTNYQRTAIQLRSMDRLAKQRFAELGTDFEHPGGFWNSKNIDAVLDPAFRETVLKYPDLVEHAFDQLSHASYTFGEMAPWERRIVKNAMPFYGWFKFITKFVWGMPFNYPGRSAALAALGRIGHEEIGSLGAIPGYLQSALWFNHGNLANAHYVNLYGLNPLGDVANPLGPGGFGGGLVRLGQLSPFLQAGAAVAGINPVSGEMEEIDPASGIESGKYGNLFNTKTGEELEGAASVHGLERGVGTFLRAFPEIRAAELLRTGGNPVYPESIPFVDEHPIAVNPQSRKGFDLTHVVEKEFGVEPSTYDIRKHTAEQIKNVREAKKANKKTIRKAKTKLKIPSA